MESIEFTSNRPEDTYEIAKNLGKLLKKNDIILLEGDLGAGKTTFTKGLAAGLEIQKNVNSPTFTIIKEYNGRLPLYHMDVYRVGDAFEDLGIDEYFYNDGVTVIEWAHIIEEQLPSEHLSIFIFRDGQDKRILKFESSGARYEALCKELFNENLSD
ncbi:tRNA (adenosine(37)-N6)-threonylcarbamoyltransferase complex ATPase subunit type 1 TsaE [Lederbergia panacisoli]|uniref:tRNA (adenosine(37)-N6)-threonylcarbamoyltransferase complex ATPase subunit type 1 TsaE n=1 Tax=Lederbergia panacisoli TaxID=1255251 RepID=UPI00214D052B|nr:tRNA (adenosine(37)-N6)-threonylcarbamoyltransferase complex ATPase subunit type 1 TsaE [Lederbergia panacisoli]MCR2823578.1 tRNA (adenosine(37)-N6)-threonylcarbamoyltransferase complex ATPase subunit type 1 TsaE [Lederbergia panacisoli]